jgi:hypothetical protein
VAPSCRANPVNKRMTTPDHTPAYPHITALLEKKKFLKKGVKKAVRKNDPYKRQSMLPDDKLAKAQRIATYIKKHCQPFLKQSGGLPLYRGIGETRSDPVFVQAMRSDRESRSGSGEHYDFHNKIIASLGLTANRVNSMATTGNTYDASSYGRPFQVFPLGDFNFTWSKEQNDLMDLPSDFDGTDAATNELEQIFGRSEISQWLRSWKPKKLTAFISMPKGGRELLTRLVANEIARAALIDCMNLSLTHLPVRLRKIATNKNLTVLGAILLAKRYADGRLTWEEEEAIGSIVEKPEDQKYQLVGKAEGIRGDDGSLRAAIKSEHEIMIHASHMIYVDVQMAVYVNALLAGEKITDKHHDKYRDAEEDNRDGS